MRHPQGKAGVYVLFLIVGLLVGAMAGTEFVKWLYKHHDVSSSNAPASDQPASGDGVNKPGEAGPLSTQRAKTPSSRPREWCRPASSVSWSRRSSWYGAPTVPTSFSTFSSARTHASRQGSGTHGIGFRFLKRRVYPHQFPRRRSAQKLFVTFSDGKQLEGRIVGVDPQTDLAVIAVKGQGLSSARLGNSDTLLIGEWAIAIGNPFGFFINDAHPTVTVGVISAVDRNFAPSEGVYYQGMIQTDAAINQGNSGGPLVDANGEVIGINTFIFTGSDSYEAPSASVRHSHRSGKRVVKELLSFGKRRTIYTGISVQDLNRSIALALGYDRSSGVVVSEIHKGSPGEAAGLKQGDIVLLMGSRRIQSSGDIDGFFLDYFVGDSVNIEYYRGGKRQHTRIVLKSSPLRIDFLCYYEY